MKKILLALGVFLTASFISALVSTSACAQTATLVSGTVKDVNGVPYSFAKVSAQLIPTTASPTIIVNGIPTQIGGQQNANADVNGNFTMNLFCNSAGGGCSVISPSGTQWQITVNENGTPPPLGTGPQACSATITITGASQSVSASFASCPALSSSGGGAPVTGLSNLGTGVDSGTANAYIATVTFPAGMSATTSGSQFTLKVNNSNTGASTINVNGTGALALGDNVNSALSGGEMTAGKSYTFIFLGSNTWVLAGAATGAAALTSSQVNAQMVGNLGINGATSFFESAIEIFTPFSTSNLPLYRQMISLHCIGNVASGCSGGRRFDIGFDADGVALLQAPQIGFVNPVESFSRLDWLGDGTAASVLVNIDDSGHNLHNSGLDFSVKDKNGRTNIAVNATAGGSTMTQDATIAIGTQSVSGCSLTAAAGGSWAGKFNSGVAGACTVTITFPFAATTGWVCDAHDTTTVADVINQTAFTTTTATISGTTASGDVITWKCAAF